MSLFALASWSECDAIHIVPDPAVRVDRDKYFAWLSVAHSIRSAQPGSGQPSPHRGHPIPAPARSETIFNAIGINARDLAWAPERPSAPAQGRLPLLSEY